jgi:hypothetical protein
MPPAVAITASKASQHRAMRFGRRTPVAAKAGLKMLCKIAVSFRMGSWALFAPARLRGILAV